MKTKDQSMEMLERYLRWILGQNRMIIQMRCDSDPIFKGEDFTMIAESYQVKLTYSGPYTPTQNTIQERRWGIITPPARAMLHAAGLPMSYWEFAVLTACYLNNRTYHSGVNGIQVTLATGIRPDLSQI